MKKMMLLAAVLMLCIGGAANAQTVTPVFCGDLPQEDCDLLTRSQEVMSSLDSAAFDFSASVTLTNLPDMPDPSTITVAGNGAFSGASSLSGDMAAMEDDPGAAMLNVLDNLDFDFSITVTIPPEMIEEADPGMPNSLTLHMQLIDGVGYLDLDPLQPLMGDSAGGMSGWVGLDLANFVRALLEEMPDLFSSMTSGMEVATMDSAAMQAYMEQFNDPAFMNQFASIEKLDVGMPDESTYRITINLGVLMSNPEFMNIMREQMAAQSPKMTEKELDRTLQLSAQMLQDLTFIMDETIGTEDAYMRALHGTFNMDVAAMMAAVEEQSGTSIDEPAPGIAVDFTVFYNSYNSIPPITASEDATIFPYQSLLGMFRQMSGAAMQGG